jgi:hypothetical protein
MVTRIGGPNAYPNEDPDAWIKSVAETCIPTLKDLPEYLRADAAATLYVESRGTEPDTPWTIVFDDDTPQQVADQLLNTLHTPDRQTPSRNSDIRDAVDAISRMFEDKVERGAETTVVAGLLVQIASGKPETPFKIYTDEARHMPMKYGWGDILARQFGKDGYYRILASNPQLESIVEQTEGLTATYYYDSELDYQRDPDSNGTLVHGFLPMDERYPAYVSTAHAIRGL